MKNNYKALCLSSGGTKGYYMLGCLNYIYEKNELNNIKYYIGTSIGSVICLLLIIDYKPIEILNYLCTNDINEHINFSNILTNLCNNYGVIDIHVLEKYLEKMVIEKIGYYPTFNDLLIKYNKYFICNTFCISKNEKNEKKIYFTPDNSPNLNVISAACMSCSVPLIFTRYVLDDNIYIDGAIFDNFPIGKLLEIIDNKTHIRKGEILAIYFNYNMVEDEIIKENNNITDCDINNIFYSLINKAKNIFSKQGQLIWENITNIFNYIKKIFYHTIFDNKLYMYNEDDRIDILCLQSNNEQINFNIKSKEKINMFLSGLEQTKTYYKNKNKKIKID